MTTQDPNVPSETPASKSRWGTIALVLVAIYVLIRFLMPTTLGETARRQLLTKLRKHYHGLNVSIGRGTFDPTRGFVFDDLRISVPSGTYLGRDRLLLSVGKLTAVGEIDRERLLEGENPLRTEKLKVKNVDVHAWVEANGKFSVERLFPMPVLGPCTPQTELTLARVHIHGPNKSRPIVWTASQTTINARPQDDGTIDRSIQSKGLADFADAWVLKAELNGRGTDIRMSTKNVRIEPSFWSRIPSQYQPMLSEVVGLQCVADTAISVFRRPDGSVKHLVNATIHDGRLVHPKLPLPLEHLRGRIEWTPDQLFIEASQAEVGTGMVRVSGSIVDPIESPLADLRVSAQSVQIDGTIAAALPEKMRIAYDKLRPVGRFDASIRLQAARSNQPALPADGFAVVSPSGEAPPIWQWNIDGSLACKGIDVEYEKFPYPISQLVGPITISGGRLLSKSISGQIGGQALTCQLDLPLRPDPKAPKFVSLNVDGPVAIDDRLIDALSPRAQATTGLERFVRSLHPRGSMHLKNAVFETDDFGIPHKWMDIAVVNGHLRYDAFSYPLYNVNGDLIVRDQLVELSNFQGTNANAAVIRCSGAHRLPSPPIAGAMRLTDQLNGDPLNESELSLRFDVSDLAMDRSLRDSLQPESRQVWDSISPGGMLDRVVVNIHQQGKRPLEMNVTARQIDRSTITNNILSLRPDSLPYRLDVIGGSVHFDGKSVRIENLRGVHDASRLSAAGFCQPDSTGRWVLALDILSGSRLYPDAELINAVPSTMRKAMRELQLRGPVNIRGKSELTLPGNGDPEPVIDWDLVLQLEGNRIGDVGPVHAIRGEIKVDGRRDRQRLEASGRVIIDSMHVYDQQITSIGGPFQIIDDQLKLGTAANTNAKDRATSIRGKLFGGDIDLDGDVELSSGNFDVSLALRNAEVPEVLADFGHGDQDLTGKLSGSTKMQGNLGSIDLLRGGGAARVAGCNLYELPLLIQFFNQFRITPSPANAFSDATLEFKLFGDLVTMDDLKIWGDIISLQGAGTMDRRRELDLTFNTQISPRNTVTRILRPLRPQRYTFWTVDVRGPLDDLQVEKRALDSVGETLGRWFPLGDRTQVAERNENETSPLRNRTGLKR